MSQLPLYNKRPLTQEEIAACFEDMTPGGMGDDHQMVLVRLDDLRKALGVAHVPRPIVPERLAGPWDMSQAEFDSLYSDHPAALHRLAEACELAMRAVRSDKP